MMLATAAARVNTMDVEVITLNDLLFISNFIYYFFTAVTSLSESGFAEFENYRN
jgi:hypothetical protein